MLTSCTGSNSFASQNNFSLLFRGWVGVEVKGNKGVVSSHNELIKCSCQEQLFAWLNC